jgi:hypothetical protein
MQVVLIGAWALCPERQEADPGRRLAQANSEAIREPNQTNQRFRTSGVRQLATVGRDMLLVQLMRKTTVWPPGNSGVPEPSSTVYPLA